MRYALFMAKTSKEQIVIDERNILDSLQENARENIDNISKKLKFSRQKVWRIINRLEDNQTIWGYTTVLDEKKANFNRYFIIIKRTTKPLNKEIVEKIISREIEENLEKIGIHLEGSYFTHGVFDWIICFTASNISQAKKFQHLLSYTYSGYIEDINILENLFTIRDKNILNPSREGLKNFL